MARSAPASADAADAMSPPCSPSPAGSTTCASLVRTSCAMTVVSRPPVRFASACTDDSTPFSTTPDASSLSIAAAARPARGLDASMPTTDLHGRIVAAASTRRPAPEPMSTKLG